MKGARDLSVFSVPDLRYVDLAPVTETGEHGNAVPSHLVRDKKINEKNLRKIEKKIIKKMRKNMKIVREN